MKSVTSRSFVPLVICFAVTATVGAQPAPVATPGAPSAASAPGASSEPRPPVQPSATLDYWEKDPKLWEKITAQHQVLVSAMNEDNRTVSKGVGLVRRPIDQVWAFATDPEKIKTTSRYLKDFTWDLKTGEVRVRIEILTISYSLKGRAITKPDPHNPRVEFTVLEGDLVPFTAELELRSPEAQAARGEEAPRFAGAQTLVRIEGRSTKDRALSWPMRVGLEILLQRTAGAVREAVEAESR